MADFPNYNRADYIDPFNPSNFNYGGVPRPLSGSPGQADLSTDWLNFFKKGMDRRDMEGNRTSPSDYFWDIPTGWVAVTNSDGSPGFRAFNAGNIAIEPNSNVMAQLNGLPSYRYDENGRYIGTEQERGWHKSDGGMSDIAGALGIMALPFAASAAGIGSAAGAAGASGAGAGAAGAGAGAAGTAGAIDLGGGLMMTADGAIVGATGAFAPATAAEMAAMGVSAGAGGGVLSGLGSAASALGGASGAGGAAGASGGFNWTSLIGPAIGAAGGIYGASQAKSAADSQLQAAREAQAKLEPWYQKGELALNALATELGLGTNTGAPNFGRSARDFGAADFQADPGYAFRQSEQQKGLERAASAQGGIGSGKFLKDAMSYSGGLASQEYSNAFNRFQTSRTNRLNPLQSLAGQGQSTAQMVGDLSTQAGNAAAAGKVGQANALTNAIGQGYSMYQNNQQQDQNNQLMNLLLRRGV